MKELGKVTYPPAYTVAALPTSGIAKGALAFATNGRAMTGISGTAFVVQASGAGTGCLVTYSGSVWQIAGTAVTVSA